jgi:hypothetical protein
VWCPGPKSMSEGNLVRENGMFHQMVSWLCCFGTEQKQQPSYPNELLGSYRYSAQQQQQ